jgi:hypothetical protein
MIDYALRSAAAGPVTLEILDGAAKPVRRYSSDDREEGPDPASAPVPLYWYRPPRRLSAAAGMHRFLWDLHLQPIAGAAAGGRGGLPIAAVPHETAPAPSTPWVLPGAYTVKLTVDGRSYTQPLVVKMDPRVKTSAVGLQQQFTLSKALYDGTARVQAALGQLRAMRQQAKDRQATAGTAAQALADFERKVEALEGPPAAGFGGGRGAAPEGPDTLNSMRAALSQLLGLLQGADVAPTTQLAAAVGERRAALAKLLARWDALKGSELSSLNAKLKAAQVPPITVDDAHPSTDQP